MVPATSRTRLLAMIQNRPDWCISRQRSWGVPIPIVFRVEGGSEVPIMDEKSLDHVIALLKEKGTDFWFSDAPDSEFVLPEVGMEADGERQIREAYPSAQFKRCRDTLDVWLDSGVSWYVNYPSQVVDL